MRGERVLVVGWSSVLHGEATAGDVLAMRTVETGLRRAGIPAETAWSAVMRPHGGLALDDADPGRYSHLVFACGPVSGAPVRELHERFAHCRRIAVGVSVIDPRDPAATGFHRVIARDAPGDPARPDLATAAPIPPAGASEAGTAPPPVLGVFLTGGQGEYGRRRRHDEAVGVLTPWLTGLPAACLDLDTRLDPRDWRLPSTPEQLQSVLGRLDAVVTMRLHGLVLALRAGVPALAVDPVEGGGKVSAQAAALGWPAALPAAGLTAAALDRALSWCLGEGREHASRVAASMGPAVDGGLAAASLDDLLEELRGVLTGPSPTR